MTKNNKGLNCKWTSAKRSSNIIKDKQKEEKKKGVAAITNFEKMKEKRSSNIYLWKWTKEKKEEQ